MTTYWPTMGHSLAGLECAHLAAKFGKAGDWWKAQIFIRALAVRIPKP